jgi:acid-sensing ion channel, other
LGFFISGEAKALLCGLPQQDCVRRAKKLAPLENCNCLPACNSVAYEAEVFQTDYNSLENSSKIEYSRLVVGFKEVQFMTIQRAELYGRTDFIANCGGLLGLFMGISVLSVVEIVYYFTLRLASNWHMQKKSIDVHSVKGVTILQVQAFNK